MAEQLQCPKCGGTHIEMQVVQEDHGSVTTTKTKSKYKEKRHGLLWWGFIGWWWWIIDLFLWIFAFFPRVLLHIGRRKKYKGESTSKTITKNNIKYRRMFTCQDCGHFWSR